MHDPLRISLVGLGRAGKFHLQSLGLLDTARLVSVFDTDQEKSKSVAKKHQCRAARDPAEAIESADIDAVIVATPTNAHFEYSRQAIEAKKPLLTEKPLGSTLAEIDACFQSAKASNVPLMVAFQRRFDPSFASLIQAVRRGDVGQPHFIRSVSRDNPVPSIEYLRISGGIYHDCMVHDLDMVVQLAQSRPTHLSAFGTSFIPEIGELYDHDSAVAMLKFESGVTASIDIDRNSVFGYDQRLEVFGDGGMLQANNQYPTTVVHATQHGVTKPTIEYSFPTRYREAYRAELACFLACVRGELDVPITYDDVRWNHLLAVGVETAARENRVVACDELETLAEQEES